MPWGLTRLQHSGQSHFVTFCCYHRRPLLTTDARRRIFESALERARHTFKLQVYGYVIMPEGGWPSLSVADAMIKRVPHSSRTLRRVGTMQLAVPFFDFPENLIIQAARTRPCKKRKDGAPFSYFVPKILKAGPPAPKEGLSGPPTRGGNAFDTANQRRASGPNRSHNILWLCLCACGSSVHFNPFGARRGG